jgi:AraC-like DNA-binding protein
MKVADIAHLAEFSSQSHFTNVMKKYPEANSVISASKQERVAGQMT